jgi:hypothetical protein
MVIAQSVLKDDRVNILEENVSCNLRFNLPDRLIHRSSRLTRADLDLHS